MRIVITVQSDTPSNITSEIFSAVSKLVGPAYQVAIQRREISVPVLIDLNDSRKRERLHHGDTRHPKNTKFGKQIFEAIANASLQRDKVMQQQAEMAERARQQQAMIAAKSIAYNNQWGLF